MRNWFTLFLSLAFGAIAWGQASNDSCEDAIFLALEPAPDCGALSTFSISADNLGAGSSFPAIQLAGEAGSAPTIVSSDVWFEIEASSNRITIEATGSLEAPVLVLFQADGCDNKLPLAWGRSSEDGAPAQLQAGVQAGQRYFILVGSGASAQGGFTLKVDSETDCGTCARRQGLLQASPAPVNGTYQAGQQVQFCYEVSFWDPGLSMEWLHGVELQFGQGWDLSTLESSAPEACTAPMGEWAWYESWQSCNTEETFGPGFAFDARQGLLCPGATALDGEPGNNFGDGPCGGILAGPQPLEFCWTVTVDDDFSTPEERNLNIGISLLGDGYSGSWMQFSCRDEPATTFLATAVPEMSLLPDIDILRAPCASSCDGQIRLSSNSGGAWTYSLTDEAGNLVYQSEPGIDTVRNLCPGTYELLVTRPGDTLSQSTVVELEAGLAPEAQAGFIPACRPGEPIQLVAGLNIESPNTTYLWTGPNGFSSTLPSPTVNASGKYLLQVAVEGCLASPAIIQASSGIPELSCEPGANSVTFSWEPQPQDTAYEINVLSGQQGAWLSATSFEVQGLSPGEGATVELVKRGTGLCGLAMAELSCQALDCPLPAISSDKTICQGDQVALRIDAPSGASISWGPAATLSCSACREPVASPESTTTYLVTVTEQDGCTSTQRVTVNVSSLPENIFPDGRQAFCPGGPLKICLPQENQYTWFSPIGFIRRGDCLYFPYTTESVAGQYAIEVELPGGCQFTEVLELYPRSDCEDSGWPPIGGGYHELRPPSTQLYPNPAQDILNLAFPSAASRTISLYRLDGQLAYRMETAAWQVQVPTAGLPTGTYLLHAVTAEGSETHKVAIVR